MKPPLIILAGGKGSRLRSVTGPDIPKPMVDVFGKPFLYWLIKHYVTQGFSNIAISTGYMSGVIEKYPWDEKLIFCSDREYGPDFFYSNWSIIGRYVVNGDTFIPDPLPETDSPLILSCNDIDAGAQFVNIGKIKIHPVSSFYDIGTPEGLERFKEYFKSHLTHLVKD